MTTRRDGRSAAERFWANVDKSADCWLWTGYLKPNGYASFYPGGGRHVPKIYVHRFAYELAHGPILDGLEVDHLCNVRHCVNPAHLEAVSRTTNLERRDARTTACRHGHEYTAENTYHAPGNPQHRYCRTCLKHNRRLRTLKTAAYRDEVRGPSVRTL